MKNYYRLLNLKNDATLEEIKSAYRELAKIVHPDVGGDNIQFNNIKEAYETLSNLSSKTDYDSILNKHPFNGDDYRTIIIKPSEVKKDVYDDVKDVLSRKFGFDKKVKMNIEIMISKTEAENGVNIEVEIPYRATCEKCFGFGDTMISKCSNCKGTGFIDDPKLGHIRIKSGVTQDDVLNVKGNGLDITARIKLKV